MTTVGTIKRRLEMIIRDFERARITCDDINVQSFTIANKLFNAVIQSRYINDPAYWHPMLCQEFPNLLLAYHEKMSLNIESFYTQLENTFNKLDRQFQKMLKYQSELRVLWDRYDNLRDSTTDPITKTCPISVYVKHTDTIVTMYLREITAHQTIAFRLPSVTSRQQGMALLSAWLNQAHLDDQAIQEFGQLCRVEFQNN